MVGFGKVTGSTLEIVNRLGTASPFGILACKATGFSHPLTVHQVEGSYRSLLGRSGNSTRDESTGGRPIASF